MLQPQPSTSNESPLIRGRRLAVRRPLVYDDSDTDVDEPSPAQRMRSDSLPAPVPELPGGYLLQQYYEVIKNNVLIDLKNVHKQKKCSFIIHNNLYSFINNKPICSNTC